MKTCCTCKEVKADDCFYKDVRYKDGMNSCCKECRKEAHYARRRKDPTATRAATAKSSAKRKIEDPVGYKEKWQRGCAAKLKRYLTLKGNTCSWCDETFESHILEFHHPVPATKKLTVSEYHNHRWSDVLEEAKKCVVVCRPCHEEIHFGAEHYTPLNY